MNKTTLIVAIPTVLGAILTAFNSQLQAIEANHMMAVGIIAATLVTILAHLPPVVKVQP